MKRLLRKIDGIVGNHPKHFWGKLWAFGTRQSPRGWHALLKWTRQHERWNRQHQRYQRSKWFAKRTTIFRRKWQRAKAHHHHTGQPPGFETWMLNGHSGNISDGVKRAIAYQVVVRHQAVTDTYDYSGHASGSLHYPWNNPDGKGHAVDTAGSDMCGNCSAEKEHFGQGWFHELLCPCSWHIFSATVYGGMYVGHGNHTHTAPYS
jgi:hypothetical protein